MKDRIEIVICVLASLAFGLSLVVLAMFLTVVVGL